MAGISSLARRNVINRLFAGRSGLPAFAERNGEANERSARVTGVLTNRPGHSSTQSDWQELAADWRARAGGAGGNGAKPAVKGNRRETHPLNRRHRHRPERARGPSRPCGEHRTTDESLLRRRRRMPPHFHPDSAKTQHACTTRAAISGQLEARGYCFSGSFGYNSAWKFAGSRRACKAIQA